jgi:hypothetical protein
MTPVQGIFSSLIRVAAPPALNTLSTTPLPLRLQSHSIRNSFSLGDFPLYPEINITIQLRLRGLPSPLRPWPLYVSEFPSTSFRSYHYSRPQSTVARFKGTLSWRACSLKAADYLTRDEFPADGIMGMGFKRISNNEANPVFQNLVETHQTSGVFAFKLASTGSELTLGGLNSDLYSGTPTYTPVTQKAFWQIDISAIKIGGTTIAKSTRAIVDSVRA